VGLILSHAKFLVSDPSNFILIEPFYLLVPWPEEQNRLLAPILPFQPPRQSAILIFILLIELLFYSFSLSRFGFAWG
jgi:hypothetical protein